MILKRLPVPSLFRKFIKFAPIITSASMSQKTSPILTNRLTYMPFQSYSSLKTNISQQVKSCLNRNGWTDKFSQEVEKILDQSIKTGNIQRYVKVSTSYMDICKEYKGQNSSQHTYLLCVYAMNYQKLKLIDKAEQLMVRLCSLKQKYPQVKQTNPQMMHIQLLIGKFYCRNKKPAQVIHWYNLFIRDNLTIFNELNARSKLIIYYQLAQSYALKQEFKKSWENYGKAYQMISQLKDSVAQLGKEHVISCTLDYSNLQYQFGEKELAYKLLEQGINKFDFNSLKQMQLIFTSHNYYLHMDKPEQSIALLQRLLASIQQSLKQSIPNSNTDNRMQLHLQSLLKIIQLCQQTKNDKKEYQYTAKGVKILNNLNELNTQCLLMELASRKVIFQYFYGMYPQCLATLELILKNIKLEASKNAILKNIGENNKNSSINILTHRLKVVQQNMSKKQNKDPNQNLTKNIAIKINQILEYINQISLNNSEKST